MTRSRPFLSLAELEEAADRIWAACSREDWLEAFAAHPKVGQQSESRWSGQEQSGVATSTVETRAALAEANQEYLAKFGYIFIVCATGKTAAGMLAMLRRRVGNDPSVEIRNAAEEQRFITRLRLRKLLSE